jgi:hypothetical protein
MAVISIKNKIKSGSLLVGNSPYLPNDYESISTVTVGAGGQSSITFSSIPSTYQHLQLRCFMQLATPGILGVRVGTTSVDTGANYNTHILDGADGSVYVDGGVGETRMGILYPIQPNWTSSVTDFLDYANTNKYKTVRSLMGSDNNGGGRIRFASAVWKSTSAIGTITLTPNSGNLLQYSSFALYGIKG